MCRNEKSHDNLKSTGSTLVWGFILVLVAASAVADVGDGEGTQPTAPNIIEKFEVEEDFGVRKALAMLGSQCQKNIVPSPSVDGSLAFRRLTNVTFAEAMEAILGDNAMYEERGNLIKVYTKEEYKKIMEDLDRRIYKIFTLYYISAAEAKTLLTAVLSGNGSIVTTTAAVTDFPTGESISSGSGGGDATAMNDTLIVYDYPEVIEMIDAMLEDIDVRPQQVLVEATILSATLTEDTQFGVDWQLLLGNANAAGQAFINGTKDYITSTNINQVITKSGGFAIGFAHDNLAAVVNAIENVSDVTILANPKILAVNKQLGQVYIGTKVGYESQTTVSMDTQLTSQVEFLDTGTKLSFRAYIGNDGYIRMDIHPKDSSGSLKENNIPDEKAAELLSNIIVKDGETVVIGGLFRDTVTSNKTQIPLLGDLPIVGGVFRGVNDQVKREEVIILLTPHIIEDPNETQGNKRKEDIRRKRSGAKDELQQISRARLAEEHYATAIMYYDDGQLEAAMEEVRSALELRPTYLEAIRLKERIIAERDGREALQRLERKMSERMDRQEAPNWLRR
jgi:type IV pilus assembly protein PilQ